MSKKAIRILSALTILMIGVSLMSACGESPKTNVTTSPPTADPQENSEPTGADNPRITIEMEKGGKIVLELFYDKAPNTVKNFISLARSGFYNGTGFHRIMPGFMIQGGDPEGTGMGGPGYNIKGEFAKNGVDTGLSHVRGIISMARQGDPTGSGRDEMDKPYYDTAGSQFFIVVQDSSFLDKKYAAFGQVLEGMDVADRIVNGRASGDRALEPEIIKNITVEDFGRDIGEPEIIK